MKHPIQKIENGRFVENAIVRYLLDNGGIDLNQIAVLPFDNADREQFAQLIGYSLSGFGSLSYVSDETYDAAANMAAADFDEKDARIAELEETLAQARKGVRDAAVALFEVHPEDLSNSPDA